MNKEFWLSEMQAMGIPSTEQELKDLFQEIAVKHGFEVLNYSDYSPFWRMAKANAIDPSLQLIDFLAEKVLPNLYLKTASSAQLDELAQTRNVTRFVAVKAQGYLTFTRLPGNEDAVTIPAGTVVRTTEIAGTIYRYITIESVTMNADDSTITVLAEAENAGSAYNLGADYLAIIEGDLTGVSVTNALDYLVIPGTDEEDDEGLRLRARNAYSGRANWHTDAKYRQLICEELKISPELVYFVRNPRGAGSADAFILFDSTSPAEELDRVNDLINNQGNHGHGDDLVCKAIPTKSITLTASVIGDVSKSDIANFIQCAFRGNKDYNEYVTKTNFNSVFSFSKLAQELHNYFAKLERVVFSLGDITSAIEVPRLTSLSVVDLEA